jgi:hypothetical protein
VPPFFSGQVATALGKGSAVYVPTPIGGAFTDPMVWQATADFRFRMIGGSAFNPGARGPAYGLESFELDSLIAAVQRGDSQPISPAQGPSLRAQLADADARAVVLGPMERRQEVGALLKTVLGRGPDETFGDVAIWRDIEKGP